MVSSVVNILLDLLFVIKVQMGVAGVAWATLIAQAISACLVLIRLMTSTESYKLILKDIRFHKRCCWKRFASACREESRMRSSPFPI